LDNEENQSLNEAGVAADETSTEVRGTVLRTMHQILLNRWAEVTMIVVLYAGMMAWGQYLIWEIYRGEQSALKRLSDAAGFFLGMGTMAYGIVTQMLMLGFLASVVHEGTRRQEPTTLLLAGRYFFWRWIRFLFVSESLLFAGMVISFQLINSTILHMRSYQDIALWVKFIIYIVPAVILSKLILVVPAEMIVRNRMVFESIRSIREYSLWWIKALIFVYILWQGGAAWIRWWMPKAGLPDWWSFGIWLGQGLWMAVGQFAVLLWAVLEVKEIRRPQKEIIEAEPER
jgi:hypothetical protein